MRAFRPRDADHMPVDPNTTITDLLGKLRIPPGKVHLTFLNGVKVDLDAVVADGDTVGIFPPLGGG